MIDIKILEKLFGKKKSVVVTPIELQEWFESNTEETMLDIDNRIKSEFEELKVTLRELETTARELKNAQSDNSLVHTNKESYIWKLNNLISQIRLPQMTYDRIAEFSKMTKDRIESFKLSSERNLRAIESSVSMRYVLDGLRRLEETVTALGDIVDSEEVSRIKEIVLRIKDLNARIVDISAKKRQIESKKADIAQSQVRIETIRFKMQQMEDGKDFVEFRELLNRKRKAKESIMDLHRKLDDVLSDVQDVPVEYRKDSIKALLEGKTLNIDKKEKERIMKIKKEAQEQKGIVEELDVLRSPSLMNYKELEYQLDHLNSKLHSLSQEIARIEDEIKRQEPGQLIRDLQKDILDITGIEVHIQ